MQILDRSARASTVLLSGHDAAFSSHAIASSLNVSVAVKKDTAKRYIGACQLSSPQANETVQRMEAKEGGRLFRAFRILLPNGTLPLPRSFPNRNGP